MHVKDMQLMQMVGEINLQISSTSDEDLFVALADAIQHEFNGIWLEKINGLDQSYWDLQIQSTVLTLHLEHYLGISLFVKTTLQNAEIIHGLMKRIQAFLTSFTTDFK